MQFEAADRNYAQKIRESFARQVGSRWPLSAFSGRHVPILQPFQDGVPEFFTQTASH